MLPVYSSAQGTQGRTGFYLKNMQGELELNLVQPQQVETQESKVK